VLDGRILIFGSGKALLILPDLKQGHFSP